MSSTLEVCSLDCIGKHRKGVFVQTSSVNDVESRLLEHGIVILSGLPGEGKTSIALEVMSKVKKERNLVPLKIHDTFELHMANHTGIGHVVLIDDIFGRYKFSYWLMEHWRRYFDSIQSMVSRKLWFVIITCRRAILREALLLLSDDDENLFSPNHVIDISSENELNEDEQRRFIDEYMKQNSRDFTSMDLKIDAERILRYKLNLGLPLICQLVLSENAMIAQGTDVGKSLSKYFLREVRCMFYSDKVKYLALVILALHENNRLEDKDFLPPYMDDNPLLPLIKEIAETCGLLFHIGLLSKIREAAKYLCDSFVQYNPSYEAYEFRDSMIKNVVCVEFGNRCPRSILRRCSIDFLETFVSTEQNSYAADTISVHVQGNDLKVLAIRIYGMLLNDITLADRLNILRDHNFIDSMIQSLFESNMLNHFVKKVVLDPLSRDLRSILSYCVTKSYFLFCLIIQGLIDTDNKIHVKELSNAWKEADEYGYHETKRVLGIFGDLSKGDTLEIKTRAQSPSKPCSPVSISVIESRFNTLVTKSGQSNLAEQKRQGVKQSNDKEAYPESKNNTPFQGTTERSDRHNCLCHRFETYVNMKIGAKRFYYPPTAYICEVKFTSEAYDRLNILKHGPKLKIADVQQKESSTEKYYPSARDELDTYTHVLHMFSPFIPTKNIIQTLLQRQSGLLDWRTMGFTESSNMLHNESDALHGYIFFLQICKNTELTLTEKSEDVLKTVAQKVPQDVMAKAIFVIDAKDVDTLSDDDISNVQTISQKIYNTVKKNVKQYNIFFLDECELPHRISRHFESELDNLVNKLSDKPTTERRRRDVVHLEKLFEQQKAKLQERIPHDTQTILARIPSVSAYSFMENKLNIRVKEDNYHVRECIKLALQDHTIEYVVHHDPVPREVQDHVKQGAEISPHGSINDNNYTYGTLGCFGQLEDQTTIGYTCEHVVESNGIVFTNDGKKLGKCQEDMKVGRSETILDAIVDIAAIEIDADRIDECEHSFINRSEMSINKEVVTVEEDIELRWLEGKEVYKKGARTGVRFGKFKGMEKIRCDGRRNQFRRMYICQNKYEQSPLGEAGDSGALICHNDPSTGEVKAIFFYIGSYTHSNNEYACCLTRDALDSLNTKCRSRFYLGSYASYVSLGEKVKIRQELLEGIV